MTDESKISLQQASERLYGDTRLRDELTDEQAEELLAWGFRQLEVEAEHTASLPPEEAATRIETRFETVRRALRLVNQMIAELPQASQARSRELAAQFVDALCEIDARAVQIDDMLALEALVAQRETLGSSEIYQQLAQIIYAIQVEDAEPKATTAGTDERVAEEGNWDSEQTMAAGNAGYLSLEEEE